MTRHSITIWVIGFFSVAIALASYRFLIMGLNAAFDGMEGHILDRRFWFLVHIIFAPIALALGIFQFLPKLRSKRPTLHRWMGRTYGVAILLSGIGGLTMAIGILDERPAAGMGFGVLSVIWVFVTATGILAALRRDFATHQRWMFRSFALTLAAVSLRLQLPFFIGAGGMDYAEASNYVSWSCWVPNLIFAEWWLRRTPWRALPA